jgi:hypothetical protein
MKYFMLFILLAFLFNGLIFGQTIYDTYSGFTVPVNPVLPPVETHPSLWFKSGEVEALLSKKNSDAYALKIWNTILADIKKYVTKTPSAQNTSERPRMAKILAFGWVMNGDTAARKKAIETLLLAYDNVPRTENKADFEDDNDEIYRATWLQNYCEAYDWLCSSLTSEQNNVIREKLITETRLLRNNMISGAKYATRPHNHRSKPAYGIITAALTLSSESSAADWLQFGLTMANTVTKYQYSSDGIYREGSHYFIYSLVNFLPYLWQYKNVSGVDHFPYYKPCFEMPVLLRNSKGWIPNIEDSYVKPVPTHMAAKAYVNTPTLLNSNEPLSKVLQWNWFNTNFFTTDYTGATNDVVWNIDEYITYDPAITQSAPDIDPNIKTSAGAVVFRNNNSYDSAPARYLYFNGVPDCDNHQHPDLLSYVIEANGTILATDAGYGKDGYSDSKRSWYTAPYAHNSVIVNSQGSPDLEVNIPAKDVQFINTPMFVFSEKETNTTALNGKISRGIAFPNKNYWVVYDLLTASEKADYLLTLHARGALVQEQKKLTWTAPSDNYGTQQKLYSYILTSGSETITPRLGYTSLFKDEVVQNYIEAGLNSDTALFMHLLYPDAPQSAFPAVSDKSIAGVIAIQVEWISLFTLQKKNSFFSIGDISSDAVFTWTSAGTVLNRFFINRGKTFWYKGSELLSSDNIITVEAEYDGTDKDALYFDTLKVKTQIKFKTRLNPASITEVLYNGRHIEFSKADGLVVFSIEGNGKVEVLGAESIKGADKGSIETFGIKGNYPNPFNPSTRISFATNSYSPVTLAVYDILGRCRRKLLNEENMKGNFEITFDGKDEKGEFLPSGVYLFSLSDGKNVNIRKGLLIK